MGRSAVSRRGGGGAMRGGWGVIAAYALVCAGTQVLWLTYAAITTETARHYGVSVGWRSPPGSCSIAPFARCWRAAER